MRALLAHDEVELANEPTAPAVSREAFDRLLGELRPKLHRYCARMTGSVIDGEDVLQATLVKAIEAFPGAGPIVNPEGWLFRIAHNAALRLRSAAASSSWTCSAIPCRRSAACWTAVSPR